MSQALYRKYRSKSFDEIVGQEATVKALKTAVSSNKISHAYLFSGPRGVGKTSIARILAYEITKLPYNEDSLPIDIIEIDGASNRGIEEIRDLREKVKIAPVIAPYKVYIIDEVHMLTTQAFNAILKTLEEPPKHVVFILATTESYKLPETILSRTQRYSFKLASYNDVIKHLKNICKKENIIIDNESIEIIAKHSGGSLRDALSALDHVRHTSNNITKSDTTTALGVPPEDLISSLYYAIASNNAVEVLNILDSLDNSNSSAIAVAKQLQQYITEKIKNNSLEIKLSTATTLFKNIIMVENSQDPNRQLFIAIISCISDNNDNNKIFNNTKTKELNNKTIPNQNLKKTKDEIKPEITNENTSKEEISAVKNTPKHTNKDIINKEDWQNVLEILRTSHNTLYGLLRMAKFSSNEKTINLEFNFEFHQKRLNDAKNKKYLQEALKDLGYEEFEINTLTKKLKKNINKDKKEVKVDSEISSLENIFGSVEVLE